MRKTDQSRAPAWWGRFYMYRYFVDGRREGDKMVKLVRIQSHELLDLHVRSVENIIDIFAVITCVDLHVDLYIEDRGISLQASSLRRSAASPERAVTAAGAP